MIQNLLPFIAAGLIGACSGMLLSSMARAERRFRADVTRFGADATSSLTALLEENRSRGVSVWCSSFTAWDDTGLPVSGGGVTLADGTVLAGKPPPPHLERVDLTAAAADLAARSQALIDLCDEIDEMPDDGSC